MKLGGVIPALLTPFDDQGQLDFESLDALVDFELSKGATGFFALGSAGGGPLMSPAERRQVAYRIIERVAGRVPVIVHVGTMPTQTAVELARDAAAAGAAALSAIPPSYYRHDTQGVIDYYRGIAGASDLPLLVYHNPVATGTTLTAAVIRELSSIPGLAGIKEASGQAGLLYEIMDIPGFTVLIANADLNLTALLLGAAGSVSTISVVVPELFVAMQDNLAQGDVAGAVAEQKRISTLARSLRQPAIAALYEALRLRGVRAGCGRRPLRPPDAGESERIRAALQAAGVL